MTVAAAGRRLPRPAGTELAPGEHDRLLARLSHAPQLVASALAASVADLRRRSRRAGRARGCATRPGWRTPSPALDGGQIAARTAAAVRLALADVASGLVALEACLGEGDRDTISGSVADLLCPRAGRPGDAAGQARPTDHSHGRPSQSSSRTGRARLARLFAAVAGHGVNIEDVRVEHAPGQPVGAAELAVAPDDQARLVPRCALTAGSVDGRRRRR